MKSHPPPAASDYRQVVVTGGPGAGKTAILEIVRRTFCSHVYVVPEAASLVFSGGFPREQDDDAKRAAQTAIYAVQRQLEQFARTRPGIGLVLCDRGTVDGLAYWRGNPDEYWHATQSTHAIELARYAAVIHLHTPPANNGYDHSNRWRVESAEEALAIDQRIAQAWQQHPQRFSVAASNDFLAKVDQALAIIRSLLPATCLAAV